MCLDEPASHSIQPFIQAHEVGQAKRAEAPVLYSYYGVFPGRARPTHGVKPTCRRAEAFLRTAHTNMGEGGLLKTVIKDVLHLMTSPMPSPLPSSPCHPPPMPSCPACCRAEAFFKASPFGGGALPGKTP